MAKQSGHAFLVDKAGNEEKITQADLDSMIADPRYHDPNKRDPAFIKKVEEGFARLYPGKVNSDGTF